MRICPYCGNEVAEQAKFCEYCGRPLAEEHGGREHAAAAGAREHEEDAPKAKEPIRYEVRENSTALSGRLGGRKKVLIAVATVVLLALAGMGWYFLAGSKGNEYVLTEMTFNGSDGSVAKYTYKYKFDKNWNATKMTTLQDGEVMSTEKREYNVDGQLCRIMFEGSDSAEVLYNYEDGIEVGGTQVYSDGSGRYWTTECYESGRVKSRTYFDEEDNQKDKYYEFDEKDEEVLKYIMYDSSERQDHWLEYEIEKRDLHGHRIKVTVYDEQRNSIGTGEYKWKRKKDLK